MFISTPRWLGVRKPGTWPSHLPQPDSRWLRTDLGEYAALRLYRSGFALAAHAAIGAFWQHQQRLQPEHSKRIPTGFFEQYLRERPSATLTTPSPYPELSIERTVK